ncbi:ribonuclease H1 protein [Rutstroemia sp. NJR-2017a WRK4]|nr:ribonuclease H1 protein [Rutstroemia sp. NJR-2017a WRK4]
MVYRMNIYVDGGCRGNGQPDAIGAAAAVFRYRGGRTQTWTRQLPDGFYDPPATNQRAEITAIILALNIALDKYEQLDYCPKVDVTIYSDSKYVVNCMTEWIYGWLQNDWKNSRGFEVVNRDLIEEANDLDDRLRELGRNTQADEACNDCMDEM